MPPLAQLVSDGCGATESYPDDMLATLVTEAVVVEDARADVSRKWLS